MSSATAVRRHSIIDPHHTHHTPSSHPHPHPPATSGGHHRRGSYIMTSAHAGRRVSFSNPAHSAAGGRGQHGFYENTYKTEPEKPFSAANAKRIMRDVMDAMLADKQYDGQTCTELSKTLADAIKQRVKEQGNPRYKIVSVVAIGQSEHSGVAFASRCVWNVTFDSYAEYTYKNSSLYAIGLVYALYCD